MLTILHDQDFADGRAVEVASAEGAFVSATARATCRLAAALIEQGYAPDSPVRLVRANPWLYGPPYYIGGVTLATVSRIDFFADADSAAEGPSDRTRVAGGSSSTMS
jgi:hypothetical protein